MAYKIVNRKELFEKALGHDVQVITPQHFVVKSGTSNKTYVVRISGERAVCTCPRQQYIGSQNENTNGCSHVQAALLARESLGGYRLTVRHPDVSVSRLKRRVLDVLSGDGVLYTARKGTAITPNVVVDEDITGYSVEDLVSQLYG